MTPSEEAKVHEAIRLFANPTLVRSLTKDWPLEWFEYAFNRLNTGSATYAWIEGARRERVSKLAAESAEVAAKSSHWEQMEVAREFRDYARLAWIAAVFFDVIASVLALITVLD